MVSLLSCYTGMLNHFSMSLFIYWHACLFIIPILLRLLIVMMISISMLVTQFCLTLCNPMDYSPPGSSVHGSVSRQEYWRGLPCPPPGDLHDLGLELVSLTSPALVGRFFLITSTIWEALPNIYFYQNVSHVISVFSRKAIVQKSFT